MGLAISDCAAENKERSFRFDERKSTAAKNTNDVLQWSTRCADCPLSLVLWIGARILALVHAQRTTDHGESIEKGALAVSTGDQIFGRFLETTALVDFLPVHRDERRSCDSHADFSSLLRQHGDTNVAI